MITPADLWGTARARATAPDLLAAEVERRATISRLYYAVFHRLQALPAVRAIAARTTFDGGMHRTYISALQTLPGRSWRNVGLRLADLHRRRVDADYRLSLRINPDHVREALHAAEAIRKLLALDDEAPHAPPHA